MKQKKCKKCGKKLTEAEQEMLKFVNLPPEYRDYIILDKLLYIINNIRLRVATGSIDFNVSKELKGIMRMKKVKIPMVTQIPRGTKIPEIISTKPRDPLTPERALKYIRKL